MEDFTDVEFIFYTNLSHYSYIHIIGIINVKKTGLYKSSSRKISALNNLFVI